MYVYFCVKKSSISNEPSQGGNFFHLHLVTEFFLIGYHRLLHDSQHWFPTPLTGFLSPIRVDSTLI
jgi:hypothetical protein